MHRGADEDAKGMEGEKRNSDLGWSAPSLQ